MDDTVFVVDDDASVRDALGLLLGLRGYRTAIFADAESFLGAWKADWRGCLLLDIRMPGMDGLSLQKHLLEIGCAIPVILISGHGNVEAAREAFRSAAVDFLEKPLDEQRLVTAIDEAFALRAARDIRQQRQETASRLLTELTPRERQVADRAVAGRHNREIAHELGISVRTVEVHKARVMIKLGTRNLSELIRLMAGGVDSSG